MRWVLTVALLCLLLPVAAATEFTIEETSTLYAVEEGEPEQKEGLMAGIIALVLMGCFVFLELLRRK